MSLDLFARGLRTCTAVARLPLHQLGFLVLMRVSALIQHNAYRTEMTAVNVTQLVLLRYRRCVTLTYASYLLIRRRTRVSCMHAVRGVIFMQKGATNFPFFARLKTGLTVYLTTTVPHWRI